MLFDFVRGALQVMSVMSMWTRVQPTYAANMWNEALNKRLGTEVHADCIMLIYVICSWLQFFIKVELEDLRCSQQSTSAYIPLENREKKITSEASKSYVLSS